MVSPVQIMPSAQLWKKNYLSIFKIHVMLENTKTESLQLLKFSKLPLDIIQDWHSYINKYFQVTFSIYY